MSSQKYIRALLKGPALLVLALLMVLGASASGLTGAVDRVLREHYYEVEPTRESGQRVLLVSADTSTIAAWGPPPWSPEHFAELEAEINGGGPTLLAIAGGTRLFDFEDAQAPVPLLAPSLPEQWSGSVDALALDQGVAGHQSVRELLARTPLMPPEGDQLDIHFLHPLESLPRVDAHRVANGEIPPSTFAGRIVLIGLTADPFAVQLPTPVGSMKLAEVHAQALLSIADRATWDRVGSGQFLAVLLMVGLGGLAGRRLNVVQALLASGLAIAAMISLDYLLFSQDLAIWGAAAPMLGFVLGCGGQILEHQYRTAETLAALSRQVSESTPVKANPVSDEEWEDFWMDMVSLGRSYIDTPHSAIIAELPEDSWHLVVRACDGITEDAIVERRRDIRRSPFRAGYLSHRAGWTEGFVEGGERSLMVPLLEKGQIYGYWMLHLDPEIGLEEEDIADVERLGRQMAQSIATRRLREVQLNEPEAGDLSGTMRVLSQGIETMSHSKDWARALAEQLPVGIMVATIFGHIEFQNDAMREHLALDFPDGPPNEDIRAVIAQLTGSTLKEAHEIMRDALKSDSIHKLQSRLSGLPNLRGDPRLSLTRLHLDSSTNFLGQMSGDAEYLLLIARAVPAPMGASDSSVGLPVNFEM
jgi:hypothetical protein